MVQEIKRKLLSLAEFITCIIIYTYFTLPLHEWIHLSVLKMLGGNGYILSTPFGGFTVITESPKFFEFLVPFSGGIFVGLIYTVLFLWNKYSDDIEEMMALLPNITSQFTYGIFEGLFIYMPFEWFVNTGQYVVMVSYIVGLVASSCIIVVRLLYR